MSSLLVHIKRVPLSLLIVFCLAALSASYAHAGNAARPRLLQIIGDPDAAVPGRLAVGTSSVGSKALTVVGVIDFLGAGTVHNYFSQGTGNNMQINSNVDEANVVADASRSQWKLVLGSSLDQFSLRRSPAGGTYNEDALFFVDGTTGNVGIATVDTGNLATIPFTPQARLHVQTASGDAIRGLATATTGPTYGVYGRSDSPSGTGVYGLASATTGANWGVYGRSESTSGYGVYGFAVSTNAGNYAGYFFGNVHVSGTLTKSAGGFRIDHPLDPANMYLNHSFVESPDMMDIYDGLVTLDDAGEAWVQLPDWFEALNRDFRYQLTPIGQFAPLYVAQEIRENRFLIAGGTAGMQVSWQVTGIRHDPYAEAHRIPVEEEKPPEEQGTYLFPELYGQPFELAAPQLQAP
jgi:hypothetical protein